MADADMMRRLAETADRQEIWNVLQDYARGLDRIDYDLVRSCYFDDAIEDHGSFVGTPDEFIQWSMAVSRSFQTTQHFLLNHHCDLDGDDAHAESYFQFIGIAPDGPHLFSVGRYIDHFQRRDAVWKIANRVVIVGRNLTLPDHPNGMAPPDPTAIGAPNPATRDRGDVSYQRPLKPRQPGRREK